MASGSPSPESESGLRRFWHRRSRKGKAGLIALPVLALLILVAVATPPAEEQDSLPAVEEAEAAEDTTTEAAPTPDPETTTEEDEAESAPAEPEPEPEPEPQREVLTSRDREWASGVSEWSETMGDAFTKISEITSDEQKILLLMFGDQDAVLEFSIPVAVMRTCRGLLPRGRPRHSELRQVEVMLRSACRHYRRASTLVARGVDNLDPDLILRAADRMERGTGIVTRAAARTADILETSG